ncbi:MAG: nucleotidyltransferase family protein [Bacteroidia bacterium]|nr:nucleotidyltransferase family protein [Bacteroidia bacterium]
MSQTAVLLLAAGGSQRMGSPKQLLKYQGNELIRLAVEALLDCEKINLITVLGAHFEEISPSIQNYPTQILRNPNWQAGLSSSIRLGLDWILQNLPETQQILITLADQPLIKSTHYQQILQKATEFPEKIVAAHYLEQPGVPVLFPQKYFGLLQQLKGDQGAGKVIRQMENELVWVEIPEAATDWDSPADIQI